jgi:hypothetical protein
MPRDLRAIASESYPCAIIGSSDKRRQNDGDAKCGAAFCRAYKATKKDGGMNRACGRQAVAA